MSQQKNHKRQRFVVISLGFMALIVVGAFFGSRYIEDQLLDRLVANYNEQERVAAAQIARTIELELRGIQDRLRLITQLPIVTSPDDVAACNTELQRLVAAEEGRIGNLGRVTLDGLFHCSVNTALIGVQASTLGPYISDIFNDPEHRPVMSRAIKPVGATSYLVGIHVPVWGAGGAFNGTLGAAVYFNNLQSAYLQEKIFSDRGFVALYDDDGTILYRPESELIGKNINSDEFARIVGASEPFADMIAQATAGEGGTRQYFANNAQKVAAFEPVQTVDGRVWTVVVSVPIEDVQSALLNIGVSKFLNALWIFLTVFVGLCAAFMIYFLNRFVFAPAAAVDKAKTEFVSLASHQLRTPLSAINWYTEMLLAGDAGKITDDQRGFLDQIAQSNKRMVALVSSLLNVSRIDLGTFAVDPVPTNFTQVADSVLSELAPQIGEKKLIINKNYDPQLPLIPADPKLLRIILQNLLSNAVKYTAEGSITLTIKQLVKEQRVLMSVADTGFGIPAEAQAKIFSKLYRADNARARDADGNGLGLYIVKSIVEQSDGKVWFVSKENQGTTFYVTLPLSGMQKKEGSKALDS